MYFVNKNNKIYCKMLKKKKVWKMIWRNKKWDWEERNEKSKDEK
jgi:hypothetical protein